MKVLYENDKVRVIYVSEINLIEFIVLSPEITLDAKRIAWDETVTLMVSLNLNKIIIDESVIKYSKIYDLIYCNEGLVQIMARAIKSTILYCSIVVPILIYPEINSETRFNPSFNQHNEIVYDFFNDKRQGIRWLISKPNVKSGFLTNLINSIFKSKKTTVNDEVEYFKKAYGIPDIPIINQLIGDEIKKSEK